MGDATQIIEDHILPMAKEITQIHGVLESQSKLMAASLDQQREGLAQHAATHELLRVIVIGQTGDGGLRASHKELQSDSNRVAEHVRALRESEATCPARATINDVTEDVKELKELHPELIKIVKSHRKRRLILTSAATLISLPLLLKFLSDLLIILVKKYTGV